MSHVSSLNMTAVTLEATSLWLLGLLFGSFALLQVHQHYISLPPVSLTLSYWLARLWPPDPTALGAQLQRLWLAAMLALAWFCLTGAISRLSRLVSRVYRSSLPKRPRWLTSLYQWCLTAIFLVITSLVLYWVGPDYLTPETADSLRLKTAEGSAVSPAWQTGLWQLIRWPVAVGMAGLGLGIFYRLSPQRWQRGTPLWPGIGLSLLLGCLGLSAGAWVLTYLNHQNLAYGVLLQLALILVGLLGIFLLIPLGAQFNVSLVNQQQISMPYSPDSPRFAAPPPSFDSFKIHRGPGDRFRE